MLGLAKGMCCVLLEHSTLRLRYLHPFLSEEFHDCANLEQRVAQLFAIKDHWSLRELEVFVAPFLEPEQKLATVLPKYAR